MRRTGHIRQRSSASWELRYSLGTDPATGKRKIATATVRGARKHAERELRRLLHSLDVGEHVDPTRVTVRQWLAIWLDTIRDQVAPKTHERYADIVRGFFGSRAGQPANRQARARPHPGCLQQMGRWRPARRQTWWAVAAHPAAHPSHPEQRAHSRRRAELIARNPCAAFKKRLPKVERREMAVHTAEQSQRLLAAIQHTRVHWPALIALATGMRRGEILALRWHNVDLDRGSVRVVESLEQTKAGLRFKAPKSEKARVITLPAFAVDEVRRLKREQAEELLRLGIRQQGDTLLCARSDGAPMQPRSLTHEFTYLIGRLKDLPRIRFHDLRHSHATQLLLAGVHPKIAQERLGHSTISVTLDLYSHVTSTMQQDAAARIDAAFQGAKMASPSS
jgi:integrase